MATDVGATVPLSDLEIEVVAVEEGGRPTELAYRFDSTLDDPGRVRVTWYGDRFVELEPPPVGVEVAPPPLDAPATLGRVLQPPSAAEGG